MENIKSKFVWNICGHEPITNFLQAAIINNKVSHAYLFVGQSGLGKQTVAREFIKTLLCEGTVPSRPCHECQNCLQMEKNLHPDIFTVSRIIDEKTGKWKRDIVIDQIRELKARLQQGTLLNSYKAALLPEAQLINLHAYNALLKIVEEPTPKTVIILIADSLDNLPLTIISRCQVINFLPVKAEAIEQYLLWRGLSQEQSRKLSRLACGRPGLALTYWQQPQQLELQKKNLADFMNILAGDLSSRLDLLEDLIYWEKDEVENSGQINALLDNWTSLLRDLLLLKNDNEPLVANLDLIGAGQALSRQLTFASIKKMLSGINFARQAFAYNLNSKFVLENLIINL